MPAVLPYIRERRVPGRAVHTGVPGRAVHTETGGLLGLRFPMEVPGFLLQRPRLKEKSELHEEFVRVVMGDLHVTHMNQPVSFGAVRNARFDDPFRLDGGFRELLPKLPGGKKYVESRHVRPTFQEKIDATLRQWKIPEDKVESTNKLVLGFMRKAELFFIRGSAGHAAGSAVEERQLPVKEFLQWYSDSLKEFGERMGIKGEAEWRAARDLFKQACEAVVQA